MTTILNILYTQNTVACYDVLINSTLVKFYCVDIIVNLVGSL